MSSKINKLWPLLKNILIEEIGENNFNLWFQTVYLVEVNKNKIVFGIDTSFKREWIMSKYTDLLNNSLSEIFGEEMEFTFKILRKSGEKQNIDVSSYIKKIKTNDRDFYLNPEYTFEKLAVGAFNELAYSYAKHLAENIDDHTINPLFIYGGVGLGKTHILQAIGSRIKKKTPSIKVGYCTMESFFNDMVKSITNKNNVSFREKYINLDLFLVDDIQFISRKPGLQERFFHVFNELYNRGKPIILTADKMIYEISDIEERLVSRFQSGQSVEIMHPNEVDRVSILKKRMRDYDLSLDNEIAYFLSQNIKGSVRDLIAGLKKISLRGKILGKELSCVEVKEVLRPMFSSTVLNIDTILKVTSQFFDIRLSEITSTRRTKNVLIPRQVAMYFMKTILKLSYPSIASEFGGKDHTTIMNAVKKIDRLKNKDHEFKMQLEHLENSLYSGR